MTQQVNQSYLDSEVDLKEIILLFWKKKLSIIFLTSIFAALSVLYALSLPNIYQSSSLLAPTDQQESLSSKLSSYKKTIQKRRFGYWMDWFTVHAKVFKVYL